MSTADRLVYFEARGRAEPIRMLYALADKQLDDVRVKRDHWRDEIKLTQPLGQVPVFTCEEGELPMSNTIARYVAKKFGLVGDSLWEETLNDLVVEACRDMHTDIVMKVYRWKVFKRIPEPENSALLIEEAREKVIMTLNYIQSVAEKKGKAFISCDKICLGDVWLYATLEFAQAALPDILEITPWIKEFVKKITSNETFKKYLVERLLQYCDIIMK